MNDQGNVIQPKENNETSITNFKDMGMCELPDKEFRIILKIHYELQENTEGQLNEIRENNT